MMSTITLTMAENGGAIEADADDTIVLQLPENPTTGVRWQIEQIEDNLELVTDSYRPSTNMQFGSGGIREFRFRPIAAGTVRLRLKSLQAWEGDRSITDRFATTIVLSE